MTAPHLPGPLVSASWLASALADPAAGALVVADVRWYLDAPGRGAVAFAQGHLPGAVFVDLDAALAGPAGPGTGRHPLPSPAAFAAAMGRLGIGDDTPVVAYDDCGGGTAARLWWLLDSLGHPAAVLDGGIDAWDGGLVADVATPRPATFTARPWPTDRFVDADETARRLQDPSSVVLDARAPGRFTGDEPLAGADPRPGHMPGARNAPWAGNLVEGHLAPADVLADRYAALGATDADTVVVSCGSGVTACHDLLALRLAGVPDIRLFPGSWSAWAADPDRPVATGP